MEKNFTSGFWKVENGSAIVSEVLVPFSTIKAGTTKISWDISPEKVKIATVHEVDDKQSCHLLNAELIASAPDLLDALSRLALEACNHHSMRPTEGLLHALEILKALERAGISMLPQVLHEEGL